MGMPNFCEIMKPQSILLVGLTTLLYLVTLSVGQQNPGSSLAPPKLQMSKRRSLTYYRPKVHTYKQSTSDGKWNVRDFREECCREGCGKEELMEYKKTGTAEETLRNWIRWNTYEQGCSVEGAARYNKWLDG